MNFNQILNYLGQMGGGGAPAGSAPGNANTPIPESRAGGASNLFSQFSSLLPLLAMLKGGGQQQQQAASRDPLTGQELLPGELQTPYSMTPHGISRPDAFA